jgi:hypothetical protein
MDECKDIKKGWRHVARRLQEFSSRADGRSKIVSITVVVDSDNNPIFWYEPTMKRIEPRMSGQTLLKVLTGMGDDQEV